MESYYSYYAPNSSELPEFSSSKIITIHGRAYQKENDQKTIDEKEASTDKTFPFEQFLQDFHSLFWFSYRKDFHPITPSTYTSDLGWGCMLRSGQMMLSQALSCHILGRDWRRSKDSTQLASQYSQVLRWFDDKSSAPYSVHRIAQLGPKYGKSIGEWFGPSTIAQVLSELVTMHEPENFVMYLSNDSVLYLDEITQMCQSKNNSKQWKSLFIMIPLRLGIQSLNDIYLPSLKSLFKFPQSLGIVGGKPRAAMYFVACQDSNFFYLDPHVVQPAVNMTEDQFSSDSFHCAVPHKMLINAVDPSLAIGFYCSDKQDFDDFWKRAKQLSQEDNPILGIETVAPEYRQEKKQSLSIEGFEDDIVIL